MSSRHNWSASWKGSRGCAIAGLRASAAALVLAFAACTSTTKPKVVTQEEIVERDNAVGAELTGMFESQVRLLSDPELSVFLRQLAQRLSEPASDLSLTGVGVLLIKDTKGIWRSFSLPGNRIYISASLLRRLEYENEIASAIAFELGHIQRRHLIDRLWELQESGSGIGPSASSSSAGKDSKYANVAGLGPFELDRTKQIDFLGPAGAFVLKEESQRETVDAAVELLYRAGYDPRGLLTIWQRYTENPKHSPFEVSTLQKLSVRTRKALAKYPPLRNPIVRSEGFIAIQKRIKKL